MLSRSWLAAATAGLVLPVSLSSAQQPTWSSRPLPEQPDVLVMRAKFEDQDEPARPPIADIDDAMWDVSNFLKDNSYGALDSLVWDIVNIELPEGPTTYVGPPIEWGLAMKDALEEADQFVDGITTRLSNLEDYHFHVLLLDLGSGGLGYSGGKVWIRYDMEFWILAQEFIHALNLAHSTGRTRLDENHVDPWDPTEAVCSLRPFQSGTCYEHERGNLFDIMSTARLWKLQDQPRCHSNARHKNYLDWLPDSYVTDVTASGSYTLYQQDTLTLSSTGPRALRIHRDETWDYWIEFRQLHNTPLVVNEGTCPTALPHSAPTNADNGVLVYFVDKNWRYVGELATGLELETAQLLDMRPDSQWYECPDQDFIEWIDAALEEGVTFRDNAAQPGTNEIVIEVDPPDLSTTPPSIEVDVTVPVAGPGSGWIPPSANSRPTIKFIQPSNTVTTYSGGPGAFTVTFEAEATDADGISRVDFEIFNLKTEDPIDMSGSSQENPVAGTPVVGTDRFTATFNHVWATDGYMLNVNVVDDDEREEADAVFFMVNAQLP